MNPRQLETTWFGKTAYTGRNSNWMTEREYDSLRKGDRIMLDFSDMHFMSGPKALEVGRTSYSKKYDVYSKRVYFIDEASDRPKTKGMPLKLFKRMSYNGKVLDPPSVSFSLGGSATLVKSWQKLS